MKKAITILAVLIVLVGAVFATETHSIRLKTEVQGVLPAFQLTNSAITATASNGQNVANAQQWSNPIVADDPATEANEYVAADVFANDIAAVADNPDTVDVDETVVAVDHKYDTEGRADVVVGDISRYAISATFDVLLVNQAKQVNTYTLTFTAGDFAAQKNGNDYNVPASSHALVAASLGAKTGVTTEGSGDSFTAAFNGTTCNETTATTTLAQYEVAYPKTSDVDPGTYYATIKLEIVSGS